MLNCSGFFEQLNRRLTSNLLLVCPKACNSIVVSSINKDKTTFKATSSVVDFYSPHKNKIGFIFPVFPGFLTHDDESGTHYRQKFRGTAGTIGNTERGTAMNVCGGKSRRKRGARCKEPVIKVFHLRGLSGTLKPFLLLSFTFLWSDLLEPMWNPIRLNEEGKWGRGGIKGQVYRHCARFKMIRNSHKSSVFF